MISLCHQYRARPVSTSMQSDQALYTVGLSTSSSSHLHIPKNDNGVFQKWKLDYSIQEIQKFKCKSFVCMF